MHHAIMRLLAAGGVLLLPGCSVFQSRSEQPLPTSRDQAAAVLVSTNIVVPWDAVASAMEPNFELKGDAAFDKVAPITARLQEETLAAFGLGLSLTTPLATPPQAGGKAPAAASNASGGAGASESPLPARASLPTAPAVAGDIGIDPISKYKAALALYQAVQLMNHEVQDFVASNGLVPYLVQLKFAVLPYRRGLPFDLYARVSFFPDARISCEEARAPGACRQLLKKNLPQIVPILVTDDLERALQSEAAETARQIGLKIAAMIHGVGAGFNAAAIDEALSAGSGQEVKSVFTVTRLVDNTLVARIGAEQTAKESDLVGQTYDVPLILMVPREYLQAPKTVVDVVVDTEFRNARTGEPLPVRDRTEALKKTEAAVGENLEDEPQTSSPRGADLWGAAQPAEKDKIALDLVGAIQDSDYGAFIAVLERACPGSSGRVLVLKPAGCAGESLADHLRAESGSTPTEQRDDYIRGLWDDLAAAVIDEDQQASLLHLPQPPTVAIPEQRGLLVDDGKTAEVRLHGVSGYADRSITAFLRLAGKQGAAAAADYELPFQSAGIDRNTGVLSLDFPSLKKTGLGAVAAARLVVEPWPCADGGYCVKLADKRNAHRTVAANVYDLALANAPAAAGKPNFDLSAGVTELREDKGAGTVTVVVDNIKDDYVKLTLVGAEFLSAKDGAGAALPREGAAAILNKPPAGPTNVTFALANMIPGKSVTIVAEGFAGAFPKGRSTGKATLSLTVGGGRK